MSIHPSDTSTDNFKNDKITQSPDIKKKEKAQTATEERKKTSSSSGGLMLDYTNIPDVLCLLTEQECF